LTGSKHAVEELMASMMEKLKREVSEIFGHDHSDRADLEPILPAGDVDQADFDAIKARFITEYL
jgi:hypothetical protein